MTTGERMVLKARLRGEGRWQQFISTREGFFTLGYPRKTANGVTDIWDMAIRELDRGIDESADMRADADDAAARALNPESTDTNAPPEPARPMKQTKIQTMTRSDFDTITQPGSVNAKVVIEWAFETWGLDDVAPEEAPTVGAWFLREELRLSPSFRNDFYRNVYPRLLPSKTQMEDLVNMMQDDGRDAIDLIDSMRKRVELMRDAQAADKEMTCPESSKTSPPSISEFDPVYRPVSDSEHPVPIPEQ